MSSQVRINRVVTVTADPIRTVQATTEAGVVLSVSGSVAVDDFLITDEHGIQTVMAAAEYAAALVKPAGAA